MAELLRGQLTNAADMAAFALAGKATLTLVSQKTGVRYTYKITKPREADPSCPHFVSVMYGSDNESDYTYLGCIYPNLNYIHGKRSGLTADDVRSKAFQYFWNNVHGGRAPPHMDVWHEGRCCRCNRKLTVPSSILNGIGPECLKHIGRPVLSCAA